MSDPRSDRIFKRIFHEHPGLLIPLLNTLLPMEDPIESIVFMPMELHPEVDEGRLTIVDVRCRDEPHYGYFGANSATRIVANPANC
jgi:hypothetical protein